NPSPPSADKSLSLASARVQTQQNSVNSPALAATPGKVFGPKKNLAKELDKESGVKRTLAEEFGSVAKATDHDSQHLDFVVISLVKATKDDKDAKVPAYGRGCRGKRTVKDEDAADKKKAEQVDAALKRKEKAEAKKKEAQTKKKEAQTSKKEAELKKKQEAELKKQKQAESKKKNVTPPRAAPADKPAVLSADHEGDFYSILIHERPWPEKEYGWVFDNVSL
ncbi:unnamed protein product, partial [Brassica oleracea var. botrytis]